MKSEKDEAYKFQTFTVTKPGAGLQFRFERGGVFNLFVEKVEGSFNSRKLKIKKSFISLKLGGEIH